MNQGEEFDLCQPTILYQLSLDLDFTLQPSVNIKLCSDSGQLWHSFFNEKFALLILMV